MPITFLDNYPRHALEENFMNREGDILYGELWVYQQLLILEDEVEEPWLVKHSYPLSKHPHSRKQEGEIDFLIIGPKGVLVMEVKGGGIDYSEGKWYYKKSGVRTRTFPDPFEQVKENMFSLKDLVNIPNIYFYRAVVLPHERNVECRGPNHEGYANILYTAKNHGSFGNDSGRIAMQFLRFLEELPKSSRLKQVESFARSRSKEVYNKMMWQEYPEINRVQIDRVRRSLFQDFQSYGFDVDRLNTILYDQNYDILLGLNKNKRIMIEGPPGSGKTVIAKKFIIQERKRDQKGIYICANLLLASYMRWLLYGEYGIDRKYLDISTFNKFSDMIQSDEGAYVYDYIIIDEAQEFFDNGLEMVLKKADVISSDPKILILYDLEQAYGNDFKDLSFFQDFIMKEGRFSHYEFHKVHRCSQCKDIQEVSDWIGNISNDTLQAIDKKFEKVKRVDIKNNRSFFEYITGLIERMGEMSASELKDVVFLIESRIYKYVTSLLNEFFPEKFDELLEVNISMATTKLRYTTPIKFKGLESEIVFLFTSPDLRTGSTRTEAYIGATRAIFELNIVTWSRP